MLMAMFVFILTLFSTLMHVYVSWSISRLDWVVGMTSQRAVWLCSLLATKIDP